MATLSSRVAGLIEKQAPGDLQAEREARRVAEEKLAASEAARRNADMHVMRLEEERSRIASHYAAAQARAASLEDQIQAITNDEEAEERVRVVEEVVRESDSRTNQLEEELARCKLEIGRMQNEHHQTSELTKQSNRELESWRARVRGLQQEGAELKQTVKDLSSADVARVYEDKIKSLENARMRSEKECEVNKKKLEDLLAWRSRAKERYKEMMEKGHAETTKVKAELKELTERSEQERERAQKEYSELVQLTTMEKEQLKELIKKNKLDRLEMEAVQQQAIRDREHALQQHQDVLRQSRKDRDELLDLVKNAEEENQIAEAQFKATLERMRKEQQLQKQIVSDDKARQAKVLAGAEAEIANLEHQVADGEAKCRQIQKKCQAEVQDLQQQAKELNEAREAAEALAKRTATQLQAAQQEIAELGPKLASQKDASQILQHKLDDETKRAAQRYRDLEEHVNDVKEQSRAQLKHADEDKQAVQRQYDELLDKTTRTAHEHAERIQRYSAETDTLQAQVLDLQSKNRELVAANEQLCTERDTLADTVSNLQERLSNLVHQSSQDRMEAEKKGGEVQGLNNALEAETRELRALVQTLTTNYDTDVGQLKSAYDQLSREAADQRRHMEDEISDLIRKLGNSCSAEDLDNAVRERDQAQAMFNDLLSNYKALLERSTKDDETQQPSRSHGHPEGAELYEQLVKKVHDLHERLKATELQQDQAIAQRDWFRDTAHRLLRENQDMKHGASSGPATATAEAMLGQEDKEVLRHVREWLLRNTHSVPPPAANGTDNMAKSWSASPSGSPSYPQSLRHPSPGQMDQARHASLSPRMPGGGAMESLSHSLHQLRDFRFNSTEPLQPLGITPREPSLSATHPAPAEREESADSLRDKVWTLERERREVLGWCSQMLRLSAVSLSRAERAADAGGPGCLRGVAL